MSISLTYEVVQLLLNNGHTLSVAESCTGGGLANEISKLAGISKIFLGSVTSYANQAKERVLAVPHHILEQHGAVSEEVAILMAKNCRDLFLSTWALSTTGIAGPTGGSESKPLGTVWIGLAGKDIAFAKKFLFAHTTRLEHRQKTIDHALVILKQQLAHDG